MVLPALAEPPMSTTPSWLWAEGHANTAPKYAVEARTGWMPPNTNAADLSTPE